MAARNKVISERFALTARIRSSDLSYHIVQSQEHEFSEILAFEMLATIETIHPELKRHLGEDLHVSRREWLRVPHAYWENGANAIYLIDLRAQARAQGVQLRRAVARVSFWWFALRARGRDNWLKPSAIPRYKFMQKTVSKVARSIEFADFAGSFGYDQITNCRVEVASEQAERKWPNGQQTREIRGSRAERHGSSMVWLG